MLVTILTLFLLVQVILLVTIISFAHSFLTLNQLLVDWRDPQHPENDKI